MALVAGKPLPLISNLLPELTGETLQPSFMDGMTILMIEYIAGLLYYLFGKAIIFHFRGKMHFLWLPNKVNQLPSLLSSVFT